MSAERIDCGDCERTFATVQARGLHRSRKHGAPTVRNPFRETTKPVGTEPADHVCPECAATFPRPSSLGIHRRHRHGVLGASAGRGKGTKPKAAKPALSLVPDLQSPKPPSLDEEMTVVMVARNNGALQLGLKGKTGTWLATLVGQAPD